jgi:pyruvate dehydrogenase E1 component beta subunit
MSSPRASNRETPLRLRFAAAVDEAIATEMRADPSVFVMATQPPEPLAAEFGLDRVRRMPISEALFTGMAIGAAMGLLRPVVLWRNATFSFVAFDQIANQAAKLRYMTGGQRDFPVTFICYGGGGLRMAAQHSQNPYGIFAQVPGLKIVAPANAADAYGLIRAAIRDDNPVIGFVASRLDLLEAEIPSAEHLVPLGQARVVTTGGDVTVVAVSGSMPTAKTAAEVVGCEGIEVELIDLRSIVPMDIEAIRASVQKTGRLVVVDEAPARCSVTSEVIALATEDPTTFRALRSSPVRVAGADAPVPYAPVLEDEALPSPTSVADAIRRAVANE